MNLLNGGYKIIGLVKKIRHLFSGVDLNNFSTLENFILHIHKNYNAYFWKFFCILFSPLELYSFWRHKMDMYYIENLFYSKFIFKGIKKILS